MFLAMGILILDIFLLIVLQLRLQQRRERQHLVDHGFMHCEYTLEIIHPLWTYKNITVTNKRVPSSLEDRLLHY